MPDAIKGEAQRFLALIKKGASSPFAAKIALAAGGGLIALADMWVEADRRGGFTSPDFLSYLKEAAQDMVKALPLLIAGERAAQFASKTRFGRATLWTLGGLGAVLSLRKVLDYVTSAYTVAGGQEGTFTAQLFYGLQSLDTFLDEFEKRADAGVWGVAERRNTHQPYCMSPPYAANDNEYVSRWGVAQWFIG